MIRSRCQLAVIGAVLPLAFAVGCGGSDPTSCVSSGDAEVCAVSPGGRITFTADGLEPGSDVTIDSELGEPTTMPVGPNGDIDGGLGLLSLFAGTEVVFTISAIAAGGEVFTGEVSGTT